MTLNIKFSSQRTIIIFENNKVTISPRGTGKTTFAVAYDDDGIPEIIPIELYHLVSSEQLDVQEKTKRIDKEAIVSYSLIQDEIEDSDGIKIPSVHSQTITFSKPIDKEKFNNILDMFIENKLIDEYEKGKLLALNDEVKHIKKPHELTAEQSFRQSLDYLKKQQEILHNMGEDSASEAARTLHLKLNSAYYEFENAKLKILYTASREEKMKPFLKFEESCDTAIQEAKETLENHWNLKTIILNIGVAVATLGLVHLGLALISGKSLMLFKPYADGSMEKELLLEELKTNCFKLGN